MPIQRILCNPPLAIARLGASEVPMEAFSWSEGDDPHIIGETRIKPEWSLRVESDGSITPFLPTSFVLKDNGNIRPVAPFIELWCDVGADGDEDNWDRRPLTKSLLSSEGLSVESVSFAAIAINMKAARRTGNPNHRFGTKDPVVAVGGDHAPKPLMATSLVTDGAIPMIPEGRMISFGSIQIIRPGDQPADDQRVIWSDEINVETIRLRVTPAKGRFYGPPGTADPIEPPQLSRGFSAVAPGDDFLDPAAGWAGEATERIIVETGSPPAGLVSPGDTYDGAEQTGESDPSLGIIDDTCEIQITATLDQSPIARPELSARTNVFCGPPDYAPDRRPFLSLSDSVGDRIEGNEQRSAAMTDDELDRWVEDLFERAFETVSLLNVDLWRNRFATPLPMDKRRDDAIPGDGTSLPDQSMGGLDALRDGDIAIPAASANIPLPVTDRAHERHRNLSDIVALKRFIRENPARLEALIRPPFFVGEEENPNATTMQMPPFMRNSNAQPLTLTVWQYDLLMEWQRRVLAAPVTIEDEEAAAREISAAAEERRTQVLQRLRTVDNPL